jgi:hypothetical protein
VPEPPNLKPSTCEGVSSSINTRRASPLCASLPLWWISPVAAFRFGLPVRRFQPGPPSDRSRSVKASQACACREAPQNREPRPETQDPKAGQGRSSPVKPFKTLSPCGHRPPPGPAKPGSNQVQTRLNPPRNKVKPANTIISFPPRVWPSRSDLQTGKPGTDAIASFQRRKAGHRRFRSRAWRSRLSVGCWSAL